MTRHAAAARRRPVWTIGAPRLLAGLDRADPLDHAAHLAVHGPLPAVDLDRLLALLDESGLTGRGGAGFPLATKLRALRGARPTVVVNGSESEPASRKDRTLLRRAPHLVLDGALAVADAVGAPRVIVAVHDAAAPTRSSTRSASDGLQRRVRVTRTGPDSSPARRAPCCASSPAARRCPRAARSCRRTTASWCRTSRRSRRPPFSRGPAPAASPRPARATSRDGAADRRRGASPVRASSRRRSARRWASCCGRGRDDAALSWPADTTAPGCGRTPTCRSPGPDSRQQARPSAPVCLALDDATCALGELARVTQWLADQSAGQCGPCAFGLPALAADVAMIAGGEPRALALAERHAAHVAGRGACAHPDGASRFVTSGLAVLGEELHAHAHGGCGRPVLGHLPLGEPS